MTKLDAIGVLCGLIERFKSVPDSYDSETDIQAIEMGIEGIRTWIIIDDLCRPPQFPEEVFIKKGEEK